MPDEREIPGFLRDEPVRDEVLSRVLREHDLFQAQREKRRELLQRLEDQEGDGKKVGYLAFLSDDKSGIDSSDIPAFGEALLSLGDLDKLVVIISSPGGDGTIAEKIIELCRAYASEFVVVVPNRAKSAATIISLGADQVVMGYCSELGPIDAQVPILVDGIPRYISAQSFIDARTTLEARFNEIVASGEDPRAILQQIASLNAPFIDHCEKLMEFSREVARKYLGNHMFAGETAADEREKKIETVLTRLSSVNLFKVHGRMIDGNAAKHELGLNVKLLGKDDSLWRDIWTYYVRAEVMMQRGDTTKLVETKNTILHAR